MSTALLVATHLATTLGTTVRAGKMPSSPAELGAVIDLAGEEPRMFICSTWHERCRFAVDFRGPEASYETIAGRARAAMQVLHGRDGQTIGGVMFYQIVVTSPPYPVATDEQNLVRIRTQYRAERAVS